MMKKKFALLLLYFIFSLQSFASGVLPETTVVIVKEESGLGKIKVQNTDDKPILLYSHVIDLKDDPNPKIHVSQPVTRLEPGQKQMIKFYLNSKLPMTVEHMKRVVFEGIPENSSLTSSNVQFSVNQDLPVIIVPVAVKDNIRQWNELQWFYSDNEVIVSNSGKHVIRLNQAIIFEPDHEHAKLQQTYILPGHDFHLKIKHKNPTSVIINPVTRYGFSSGSVSMPVEHAKIK